MDGQEPPITHGLLRAPPPQHKEPDVTIVAGRGLRPPPTHGPPPDLLHSTPGLFGESLTQLPKELHPQGSIDEEEQHEEEAQVAHLWGQRWGWAGRGRVEEGRWLAGSGQRACLRVGTAVALHQALSPCLPPAS